MFMRCSNSLFSVYLLSLQFIASNQARLEVRSELTLPPPWLRPWHCIAELRKQTSHTVSLAGLSSNWSITVVCRGLWPALDWTLAGAGDHWHWRGETQPDNFQAATAAAGGGEGRATWPVAAGPGTGWWLAAGHVTEPATGPVPVLQQQEKSEARHEVVM